MKVKYMQLVTPVETIEMEGREDVDMNMEELDQILKDWEMILTHSSYFKFSAKNIGYGIPGDVLKNSIVKIVLEEESNG